MTQPKWLENKIPDTSGLVKKDNDLSFSILIFPIFFGRTPSTDSSS